jgi:hypothetical protein
MGMTKYYVDDEGNYIGGFDGAEPPAGAIEVPEAPADARQKWSGDGWSAAPLSLADYENAIQHLVDTTATEKMFRDGVTLASYVASTNPQWAAEAQAFVAWRDAVWAYSYAELAKVQAGEREQPSPPDFLTELPAIAWPN